MNTDQVCEIISAALEVSQWDWGTSVSEQYHFRRMSSMDYLRRSVLNAGLTAAIPPQADQQKETEDPK